MPSPSEPTSRYNTETLPFPSGYFSPSPMAAATTTSSPPPPLDMPTAAAAPPPHPLPTTARRPRRRAREVSSRYLSTPSHSPRPSAAAASTSSPRAHYQPSTPFANENHPPPASLPPSTASRKCAVVKLFDEMPNPNPAHRPRPPTPAPAASIATPKFARTAAAATARRGYPRPPTPGRTSSDFSDASSDASSTVTDFSDAAADASVPALCDSPPLLGRDSCRGRAPCSELRSSLPEAGPGRTSNPLCYRSLNWVLTNCQAAARPPQPPKAVEARKVGAVVGGKKDAGRQEGLHQLRLLHNFYVQYRFLNAKTAAAAKAKNAAAEVGSWGVV